MRACCALLVFVVVVLPQRGARVEAIPKWFTFYGDDPDNQHEWSNLGTSGITGIKGIQPPTLPPLPPAHHPTSPDRAFTPAGAQTRGTATAGAGCCTSPAGRATPTGRHTATRTRATAAPWAA